jgi:hypothetical protein
MVKLAIDHMIAIVTYVSALLTAPHSGLGPDSVTAFSERYYTFSVPGSWQRDNRGVAPLFYIPDSNGTIDRTRYFSILDEKADSAQLLEQFVQEHVALSADVWKRFGTAVTFSEPESVVSGDKTLLHLELQMVDQDQVKRQWFLKSGEVVYIFELTVPAGDKDRYDDAVNAVLRSFALIER